MNEEMRGVIGVCADCFHCMCRIIERDEEDLYTFKCLLSNDCIEDKINTCSHFYNRNETSLFLTEQFR
jgi:hypothetical protein